MKFMSSLAIAAVAVALAFTSINAEASKKRMGGGKSSGQQSQNVTNKQAAPANAAPANAAPAKPAAAPAAAPKPWGAMLGGLAAGLGLAWLANSMGLGGALGGAMGSILMMIMFAVLGFVAWNMYKRYKANQQGGQLQPAYANGYNPQNVGNDSAARPFERTTFKDQNTNFQAPAQGSTGGSMIGSGIGSGIGATSAPEASGLGGAQTWGIPADFDTAGFLTASKSHFVALQAAWDKSDMDKLRAMMTEEMVTEIRAQIAERDATSPAGTVHHTEVVSIDAHLLGIEEISATRHYMASVEFSGQIRDEAGQPAESFREVWNLTKPVAGGGWLVAGIQAV